MDLDYIILLAKETEVNDPIDWDSVSVDKDLVYSLMAETVREVLNGIPEEEHLSVCAASLIKMLVENFVLNLKNIKNVGV